MAENIVMPKLGFDMREGVLVRWVKTEGEQINKGDVLAEIETDKATVEVESSAAGVVRKLMANQGDSVPVGAVIAVVGSADEVIQEPGKQVQSTQGKADVVPTHTAPAPTPVAETVHGLSSTVKASPLAKKVAKDNKVDLARIQGTGPGGRIVRKDIEAALATGPKTESPKVEPRIFESSSIRTEDQSIKMTKLRQAIGRRLVESKQSVPHFYVSHEYKMEALMALRAQVNGYLPEGEKISVNDFIVKAVAMALRQFPNVNASWNGDSILRHGAINVGVAVTVEGGLLTVVSKHTDQKTLRQISAEVKAMAKRAREGKVKPEDVDGSTFSTSNLGMYDVDEFIAIINPPEAAILAIASAREVPVVESGELKVGWRMKATISVDHRVSDGAEAAQFMQALAKYLEEPVRLLV